jgi:hypothetical protein
MAAVSIPIPPAARWVVVVAAAATVSTAAISLPAAATVVRSAARLTASSIASASMSAALPPAVPASPPGATLSEGQAWRGQYDGDYRYDHNRRFHACKSHLSLLYFRGALSMWLRRRGHWRMPLSALGKPVQSICHERQKVLYGFANRANEKSCATVRWGLGCAAALNQSSWVITRPAV